MLNYKQITDNERVLIAKFRSMEYKTAAIAILLNRHRSSIYREINRNKCNDGAYRVEKAGSRTRGRRSRSRKHQYISDEKMNKVFFLIRKKYSPEQVSGFLKKTENISISHETIYKRIWADKKNGGCLYKYLRQSSKVRWKRYKGNNSRGKLLNKPMIDARPISINERSEFGHWEIDLVHGRGSKHCVLTLVERKTGYLLMGKLINKTVNETNRRLMKLMGKSPEIFKTITADNGTEFHGYKEIQQKANLQYYFCHPYHSWERGTNENTNGLIRQYLPKKSSMTNLTQVECTKISKELNERPRKRYDYDSPQKLFIETFKNVALVT
jgi:IS30 family transposase